MSKLTTLYLSDNAITAEGAITLAKALKTNNTLEVLDLRQNNITDEVKQRLRAAVATKEGFKLCI